MRFTILDTKTGERRIALNCGSPVDSSLFCLTEGNDSCDCNRAIYFDRHMTDCVIYDEQRDALGLEDGTCLGERRFLVCDVEGDLEGLPKAEVIKRANENYPPDLVAKHLGAAWT